MRRKLSEARAEMVLDALDVLRGDGVVNRWEANALYCLAHLDTDLEYLLRDMGRECLDRAAFGDPLDVHEVAGMHAALSGWLGLAAEAGRGLNHGDYEDMEVA